MDARGQSTGPMSNAEEHGGIGKRSETLPNVKSDDTPPPPLESEDYEDVDQSERAMLVPTDDGDNEGIKRLKLKIWKNVCVISLSFMCLFTAFSVATVLQSSLNAEAGLGTTSQATIYVGQILSSMFIPSLVMNNLGLKWTMVVCQLSYSTYIAAQFYATFYTLIPSAALVGVAAAPLWAAQSIYITQAGVGYTKLIGQESVEPMIARFFGIFFMIMPMATIWGNLISSVVLTTANASNITDERLDLCGVNFCYDEFINLTANDTADSTILPPENQVEMLFGILLGFGILASIILACFIDSPARDESDQQGPQKTGREMLIATFQHAKNPYQILIIPLTMWTGFGPTFIAAEFTEAFIACSWGIEHIGYVMVCHGATAALGSIIVGNLIKVTGRIPIILLGASINITLISTMLFLWNADPNHPEFFFIIAGLWGVGNAIWNTQINSFYGVVFVDHKEAGFSNLRLWQSLGFAIAYAYSKFLCVQVKLFILLAILTFGIIGYLSIEIAEFIVRKRKRETAFVDAEVIR